MSLKDWKKPKKPPEAKELASLIGHVGVCGDGRRQTVGTIRAFHVRERIEVEFDCGHIPLVQVWPLAKPSSQRWVLLQTGKKS